MKPAAALATLAVTASLVTGCGDRPSDPATGAGWQSEHLEGEAAVDHPTILATDGEDALVVFVSDDGTLRSHLSEGAGGFEAGEPLETGERHVGLADAVRLADGRWYALGSGGTRRVEGDDELLHRAVGFRSRDGLAWERVDVAGLTDAVDVHDLQVVGDTVVAVGADRAEDDPSMGGFEARAWVSTDGVDYQEVRLPGVPDHRGHADESYAGSLTATDDGLLAGGSVGRHAALWRSDDGGQSWQRVADPVLDGAYAIAGMHAIGATVVAATAGSDTQAARSEDGGRTWRPVAALPAAEGTDGWAPLWVGPGRFFTLTGSDDTSWSEPEVCYADPDQCGRSPGPALVASQDGTTWTGVDTGELGEIDHVVGTDDGRVLVLTGEGGGRTVHSWPAAAELPPADEPVVPETVELVEVPEGERPEVGVRYHAPLYTHCGDDWLFFADRTWRRTDDGAELGEGGMVHGYATVRADGVLEYSLADGAVVARYEQRRGAPGCA